MQENFFSDHEKVKVGLHAELRHRVLGRRNQSAKQALNSSRLGELPHVQRMPESRSPWYTLFSKSGDGWVKGVTVCRQEMT